LDPIVLVFDWILMVLEMIFLQIVELIIVVLEMILDPNLAVLLLI